MSYNNRVFGCAIVKAINSNYNADFSGQPRTLPNGIVYATDKAYKYTIRNFIKDVYPNEIVFFSKTLNENLNPISLDETYKKYFGDYPKAKIEKKGKKAKIEEGEENATKENSAKETIVKPIVANNLLKCIDIRFFGATFAGETNISVHGPVQITHGINIWHENNIFSEQISSPFSNKSDDPEAERGMTTLGRQSRLQEGHYLHHFSINPGNLVDILSLAGDNAQCISIEDIAVLKEAMKRGATYYDSASKAGTENELLFWVELNENSKLVLPVFTEYISLDTSKSEGKSVFNFVKITEMLTKYTIDIKSIELHFNSQTTKVLDIPQNCKCYEL
jgi:CRISPR-associated protein Csh2